MSSLGLCVIEVNPAFFNAFIGSFPALEVGSIISSGMVDLRTPFETTILTRPLFRLEILPPLKSGLVKIMFPSGMLSLKSLETE